MSIIVCKFCGNKIDTDFDTEHEEQCEPNPEVMEEEMTCGSMDRF